LPIDVDSSSPIVIDTPTSAVDNLPPRSTGLTSARTGGFELAIGSFNFYMDDVDVS
jgi:hypothetical protein